MSRFSSSMASVEKRGTFKRVVLLLFLAVVATGAPVEERPAQPLRFEQSYDAMGTTWTVVLYGRDRFRLQSAADQAFEEVRRLEELLSNYRPNSEWSEVNRTAAENPVRVSDELFSLVAACKRYSEASQGAFDITVGPLMKVWGFYKGSGRMPHRAEIRGALAKIGYKNIELDHSNKSVHFRRRGVEMDPGGIGKGYAVDRMVDILKRNGIESGFITAGSSTVYGIGIPPTETRGWRVTIRHPKDDGRSVAEVFLMNESMSTSGNYEKFFRAGRRIYAHIMDPRTGYPAQGMLSASVIAPKALDSEAWTKPYFINGRRWAASHKQDNFRVFLCEDKAEPSCAWLQ